MDISTTCTTARGNCLKLQHFSRRLVSRLTPRPHPLPQSWPSIPRSVSYPIPSYDPASLALRAHARPLRCPPPGAQLRSITTVAAETRDQSSSEDSILESLPAYAGLARPELESLSLLEWPVISQQVAAFASTAQGRAAAAEGLRIGATFEDSEILLAETRAASTSSVSFEGVHDVRAEVHTAREISGSGKNKHLKARALARIASTLRAASRLYEATAGSQWPGGGFAELQAVPVAVADRIQFCVNERGTVLDRADEDLAAVRVMQKENTELLQCTLEGHAQRLFEGGDAEVAQVVCRRYRWCVPVRRGRTSALPKGVVLDTSNSGATLFMEPADAVPLNNAEAQLLIDEHALEVEILHELTCLVSDAAEAIWTNLDGITRLDLACARAQHAKWMGATCPQLAPPSSAPSTPMFQVEGIMHPILLAKALPPLDDQQTQSLGRQKRGTDAGTDAEPSRPPQPLDFPIAEGTRVVAITGPNTGGKTAAMKTIGLACLMAKAGLFLPIARPEGDPPAGAGPPPVVTWFDKVLADIGDSQSLSENLSTFSGHIRRIRGVLGAVTGESLVLLDELGSGTDPSEGAALARALLGRLATAARLTLATTHFADVKAAAEADPRFVAVAVEFDVAALRPTYRLLWGAVGQSNALDIAEGLGAPAGLLEDARRAAREDIAGGGLLEEGSLLAALQGQLRGQEQLCASAAQEVAGLEAQVAAVRAEVEGLSLDEGGPAVRAAAAQTRQQREQAFADMAAAADPAAQEGDLQARIARVGEVVRRVEGQSDGSEGDGAGARWSPQVGEQVVIWKLGRAVGTVQHVGKKTVSVLVSGRGMAMDVKIEDVKKHTPLPKAAGPVQQVASTGKSATMSKSALKRKKKNKKKR